MCIRFTSVMYLTAFFILYALSYAGYILYKFLGAIPAAIILVGISTRYWREICVFVIVAGETIVDTLLGLAMVLIEAFNKRIVIIILICVVVFSSDVYRIK